MTGFQVGDVVVCVDDRPSDFAYVCECDENAVEHGIYRVTAVCVGPITGRPMVSLFEPCVHFGDRHHHYASRFRKLKAADEQFTEQMRALRPAKVSATLSRSSENRNG